MEELELGEASDGPGPLRVLGEGQEPGIIHGEFLSADICVDANLSPERRVPASELYDLAPLQRVKAALAAQGACTRPCFCEGSAGGILAPYPVRLERELEKMLPGIDATVQGRSFPGDVTADAVGTIMNITGETEPDLVVWQVGIDDPSAQAEIAPFSEALDEIIAWFRSHEISAVLVKPP